MTKPDADSQNKSPGVDAPRSAFQFQIWHVLVLTAGGALLFWLIRNPEHIRSACAIAFVLVALSLYALLAFFLGWLESQVR
jgi:hypothetical protein